MNCMKCGRQISGSGVFCAECLDEMDKYPIKPGTVVHLPRRKQTAPAKRALARRKPQPTPEEQVKGLRKLVRRLLLALLISILLLVVTGYFAVTHLLESEMVFLPGQNYSAIGSSELDEWD